MTQPDSSYRVLVIDDNEDIHEDLRKVLATPDDDGLAALTAMLLDESDEVTPREPVFEVATASQGRAGLEQVESELAENRRFAVVYVDMRMPPGWDGLETMERIRAVDPNVQFVVCSAFSDHSWDEVVERLGKPSDLLILKKPFDPVAARQCAKVLSKKWDLERE